MKSQADIIYNHIVKAETDNVETIEINYIETIFRGLNTLFQFFFEIFVSST